LQDLSCGRHPSIVDFGEWTSRVFLPELVHQRCETNLQHKPE
jgi:hypothetical protein